MVVLLTPTLHVAYPNKSIVKQNSATYILRDQVFTFHVFRLFNQFTNGDIVYLFNALCSIEYCFNYGSIKLCSLDMEFFCQIGDEVTLLKYNL